MLTAPTDSLFITGAIEALEGRIVGYANLPGASLHTLTDKVIIVLLTGELCKLMVKVEPKIYQNICDVQQERKTHVAR